MFKQAFGSPRIKTNQQQQQVSILSPRNFIKLITNGIGELKNNMSVPNQNNYQQFIATFAPYLQSFQEEIKKYHKNKNKKQNSNSNSKHEQLQLQLKINKIPTSFFVQPQKFKIELFKRLQSKKRQEELSQYLDEIQLVLFIKAGKYPQKSNVILQNMELLESETDVSLQKVVHFRAKLKEKLLKVSSKQLKIKRIQQKIERMKSTLKYLQTMKKMKSLKDISSSAVTRSDGAGNEQVLLKIKKTQIDLCFKLKCLKVIVSNLQKYRQSVKQKLYKQFLMHIEQAINQLLQYNKEEWKNINVPSSIFVGQVQNNDISHNNITVLDQSYFAFQSKNINIINKRKSQSNGPTIYEENQQENAQVIEMPKITKLWNLIKEFDLYDQIQVNEQFMKVLMKHNINFNQDMQEYITFLYQSQIKQKNATLSILKGPQTYASLKNKQKQENKNPTAQTSSTDSIELSSEKISFMDMKLFLKITKFYFSLLKKLLTFIRISQQLQFLANLKQKLCQFLEGIITYFTSLKKITHQLSVEDFFTYLQIIVFWQNEDLDQIAQFCENLKVSKIEEYLTNIQKNLLIKELKQSIQQSNYLPITISSDNYMTFHSILSPNSLPQFQNEDMNMSMTLQLDQNRIQKDHYNSKDQGVKLRLINNYVVYNKRVYKICDSFMQLARNIEKYVKIKEVLPQTQQNIEQKMCEIIGFYAWYNQKQITNTKIVNRTLKNYCTFFSTLLLVKCVIQSLGITNKKIQKTRIQLNQCESQLMKLITMTPFMSVEQKISQLYESKISTRPQIPTGQSLKILQVLKSSVQCLKQYFPIQYEQKLHESYIYKFTQTTIKIIYKNYFGYLVNMQKRGIAQIKWFLPKLKEILQITSINSSSLINKKGELLCKNGSYTFYLFSEEIQEMQRILRQKTGTKI